MTEKKEKFNPDLANEILLGLRAAFDEMHKDGEFRKEEGMMAVILFLADIVLICGEYDEMYSNEICRNAMTELSVQVQKFFRENPQTIN